MRGGILLSLLLLCWTCGHCKAWFFGFGSTKNDRTAETTTTAATDSKDRGNVDTFANSRVSSGQNVTTVTKVRKQGMIAEAVKQQPPESVKMKVSYAESKLRRIPSNILSSYPLLN